MVASTCVPGGNKYLHKDAKMYVRFCCRCLVRWITLTPLLFSVPIMMTNSELAQFQLPTEIEVHMRCGVPIPTNDRVPGGAKKPKLRRARASTNNVVDDEWFMLAAAMGKFGIDDHVLYKSHGSQAQASRQLPAGDNLRRRST